MDNQWGPLSITPDNLPKAFEEFEPLVSVYLWKDPEDPSGNLHARATVCIEHNELFTDKMLCSLDELDETVAKTLIMHAVKVRFWEALGMAIEPDSYELPYELPEVENGGN